VKAAAASVDHLEFCSQEDISLLKSSQTIPTILPGAAFFLSLQHPPARRMIDAGLPVAIASDYNPGSSPSGNMKLMCSIACIQYRLTPAEALNTATVNTAYSIRLHEEVGTITRGKLANLIVTHPMDSPAGLFYSFGTDSIEKVIINGQSIR
jgi:imidazolonepropionase